MVSLTPDPPPGGAFDELAALSIEHGPIGDRSKIFTPQDACITQLLSELNSGQTVIRFCKEPLRIGFRCMDGLTRSYMLRQDFSDYCSSLHIAPCNFELTYGPSLVHHSGSDFRLPTDAEVADTMILSRNTDEEKSGAPLCDYLFVVELSKDSGMPSNFERLSDYVAEKNLNMHVARAGGAAEIERGRTQLGAWQLRVVLAEELNQGRLVISNRRAAA